MASAILYGEFVQSIYDTINTNEGKFLLWPLYGKSYLFERAAALNNPGRSAADVQDAGLGDAYSIKRYIYCTIKGFSFWDPSTPWIGYIAESSEEETERLGWRDIVVAIRGTMSTTEWIKDLSFAMSDFPFVQKPASGAQVHAGFLSIYSSKDPTLTFGATSMREQICTELRNRLGSDNTLPVHITIAGHSLGAALATLVACDVGGNVTAGMANVTVSAITFGSPKVGNAAFKTNAEKHAASIWRYRSVGDLVPSLPPSPPYVHVGTELILDWAGSPYVSLSKWHPFKCHNLELHMHVMAAEGGIAVYTSDQLEKQLARFPLSPRGSTYVIEELSEMSAWDDEDRGPIIRRELEDVRNCLTDDQPALEAYLQEIHYMAIMSPSVGAPRGSPFDGRDYSLLNKSDAILKADYCVPTAWLLHPNKDMARDPLSYKWLPRVKRPYDIPTPDNPEYN